MTIITIEAGNRGGFTRTLTALARVGALAAVLALAGTAQAADSADRIAPPNPNDVAILRGLLALQNPALRQTAGSVPAPTMPIPAVTTEPGKQNTVEASPATEGEACIAPAAPGTAVCSFDAESGTASAGDTFRASLDRAMAAADLERF